MAFENPLAVGFFFVVRLRGCGCGLGAFKFGVMWFLAVPGRSMQGTMHWPGQANKILLLLLCSSANVM